MRDGLPGHDYIDDFFSNYGDFMDPEYFPEEELDDGWNEIEEFWEIEEDDRLDRYIEESEDWWNGDTDDYLDKSE